MCRSEERTHKHHLVPKYMGGSNEPENLVEVTVTQHAMFHFCNYQLWGNEEDRIAWRCLSGQITIDEAKLEAIALGSKKGGQTNKEKRTGICGLTFEQRSKNGKKGGKIAGEKNKRNGTGFFAMSFEEKSVIGKKSGKKVYEKGIGCFSLTSEERIEVARKVGQKTYENGTGIFSLTPEEKIDAAKKGGQKSYEKRAGVHAMSFDEKSAAGKKAAKTNMENGTGIFSLTLEQKREAVAKTNSQKWKCTVTGFVSTPGPLTIYQRKREIDPSKRIQVE